MKKKPVLMVLTSHRMDCFSLCLDCLEWFTDLDRFQRIYILANDVEPEHDLLIQRFKARHPNTWDIHCAPRARGFNPCLIQMENSVFRRHLDDVIVKIDEDVFVTPGWLDGLLAAWERHKDDYLLVSAMVPNNQVGKRCMLPFLRKEFGDEFQGAVTENPVHLNGLYGAWIWDKVLRHDLAGHFHRSPRRRDVTFNDGLNINCIVFSRPLLDHLFPLTENDEHAVNMSMKDNGREGIMTSRVLVHHYAFYRQSELDEIVPMEVVRQYFTAMPRTGSPRSAAREVLAEAHQDAA